MCSRINFLVFICTFLHVHLHLSAIGGVVRGDCYTLLGISTCNNDNAFEYPFSIPWWFVNVRNQIDDIQKSMLRFEGKFVGDRMHFAPEPIKELWKQLRSDTAKRFMTRVVQHFQDREEPVDLLLDEDIDYVILSRAFRIHYEEILKFLREFIDTADLDEDLRQVADAYINYIKFEEIMLRFAPDPTKSALFDLIIQGIQ